MEEVKLPGGPWEKLPHLSLFNMSFNMHHPTIYIYIYEKNQFPTILALKN